MKEDEETPEDDVESHDSDDETEDYDPELEGDSGTQDEPPPDVVYDPQTQALVDGERRGTLSPHLLIGVQLIFNYSVKLCAYIYFSVNLH